MNMKAPFLVERNGVFCFWGEKVILYPEQIKNRAGFSPLVRHSAPHNQRIQSDSAYGKLHLPPASLLIRSGLGAIHNRRKKMKDDELKALFKKAAKISEAVPESLREAAFNRAVDALLGVQQVPSQVSSPKTRKTVKRTPSTDSSSREAADPLLTELDHKVYPQMETAPRVLERALMLLRIAKDDFQIDGLGSIRIAKVLTEKFRYRTTYQAVQQALGAAGNKIDRISTGRKTTYRIMHPGELYLDAGQFGEAQNVSRTEPTKGKKLKKVSGAKKPTRKKVKRTSQGKKAPSRSKGSMVAIKEIVAEGYFSSARRIGDVQKHLQHKKGLSFKVTALSPVLLRLLKDNVLDRVKAEDGQYEYKQH